MNSEISPEIIELTEEEEKSLELTIPLSNNNFKLEKNTKGVILKGNNNTLKISKNSNFLQILGNKNEVEILENKALISIMGNFNKVVVHKNECFEIYNDNPQNEFISLDFNPNFEDEILLFNALNSYQEPKNEEESPEGIFNKIGEYRKTMECPICLERLKDLPTEELSCGHKYHRKCIAGWLEVKIDCPLCRNKYI